MTASLIPPTIITEASGDMTENTDGEGLSEVEKGFRGTKNSMSCMTEYT